MEPLEKTIEEKYKALTQREHVLLRPDTYVGSMEISETQQWVSDESFKASKKWIKFSPAFLKCFDEVLTNASDQAMRVTGVKNIWVTVKDNVISVENDGPGIEVQMHLDQGCWVPEMIFGRLMTGANYDDNEDRMGAGRNGFGAKLTNIFSKSFEVYTIDDKSEYVQSWQDNMSVCGVPKITKAKKTQRTKITYLPDLEKFGMTDIDDDHISLIIKRCIDISAYLPNVKVWYNGNLIPIKTFKNWIELHLKDSEKCYTEDLGPNWTIGVAASPSELFEQVSIVNGVSTYRGGTHVNFISLKVAQDLTEMILKGKKGINLKWPEVKNHLMVFVIAKIPNPVFDTQTKENLTSRITTAHTDGVQISDSLLKAIMKSEIVESIMEWVQAKEMQQLKKLNNVTNPTKVKINKLEDAHKAGTDESEKCSLFLCEGDSAVGSAIVGMSEIGREYYGAFPLRGKVLNIKKANVSQIMENVEIGNIIKAVGLEPGKKYLDKSSLRYGKLVIFTDADCWEENTLVKTPLGKIRIGDIKVGDLVKTHHGTKPVIGVSQKITDDIITFTINGSKYVCSSSHKIPVWSEGKTVIKLAKDILKTDHFIKQLDKVMLVDRLQYSVEDITTKWGEWALLEITDIDNTPSETLLVDIEVQDDSTFLVSNNSRDWILSHNCDGIHIKGLLINMIHTLWPELLELDFLYEFVTPIVSARKGKELKEFYSIPEYTEWAKGVSQSSWLIKYYKGLGSIIKEDIKRYFQNLDKHLIPFLYTEKGAERVDLLFNQKRANDRKEWMYENYNGETIPVKISGNPLDEFFDKEMVQFSMLDTVRSIPALYDGLKPSQRKILYTCIGKSINSDTKVSRLAGAVGEYSGYHSGEMSLHQAITGMAQDFVGSNNLNLLVPRGSFGTRKMGGSDAASPRYIETYLNPITQKVFRPQDNDLLDLTEVDGDICEPFYYLPIIPMVLINGATGIGTGWSTDIPCYKMTDVIDWLIARLENKKTLLLKPHWNNFKGLIETDGDNIITKGLFERESITKIKITELPVGIWTDNYIQKVLDKLYEDRIIKDYVNNSDDQNINISISMSKEQAAQSDAEIINMLSLTNAYSTKNMHLFKDTKIIRYNTPEDIIIDFMPKRLELYQKRKDKVISKLLEKSARLEGQVQFIQAILKGVLKVNGVKKDVLEKSLDNLKIQKFDDSYDYLLSMPVHTLTLEKSEALIALRNASLEEIKVTSEKTSQKWWLEELVELKKLIK